MCNITNREFTSRLFACVLHDLMVFKDESAQAGNELLEAVALVMVGDKPVVEVAEKQLVNSCNLSMLYDDGFYRKLICTISPKQKKLEEIEEAKNKLNKLRAELKQIT